MMERIRDDPTELQKVAEYEGTLAEALRKRARTEDPKKDEPVDGNYAAQPKRTWEDWNAGELEKKKGCRETEDVKVTKRAHEGGPEEERAGKSA